METRSIQLCPPLGHLHTVITRYGGFSHKMTIIDGYLTPPRLGGVASLTMSGALAVPKICHVTYHFNFSEIQLIVKDRKKKKKTH